MQDQMYTPQDLMEILSLSRTATYTLLRENQIPHYKLGRNIRVAESDIAEYLSARRQPDIYEDPKEDVHKPRHPEPEEGSWWRGYEEEDEHSSKSSWWVTGDLEDERESENERHQNEQKQLQREREQEAERHRKEQEEIKRQREQESQNSNTRRLYG